MTGPAQHPGHSSSQVLTATRSSSRDRRLPRILPLPSSPAKQSSYEDTQAEDLVVEAVSTLTIDLFSSHVYRILKYTLNSYSASFTYRPTIIGRNLASYKLVTAPVLAKKHTVTRKPKIFGVRSSENVTQRHHPIRNGRTIGKQVTPLCS